jgi:hypothetical protein
MIAVSRQQRSRRSCLPAQGELRLCRLRPESGDIIRGRAAIGLLEADCRRGWQLAERGGTAQFVGRRPKGELATQEIAAS